MELVFAQPEPKATSVLAKMYSCLLFKSQVGENESAKLSVMGVDLLSFNDQTYTCRNILDPVFE